MKRSDKILLIILMSIAGVLIVLSKQASAGARYGLALAQSTIVPSLLPLLIIFFLIMKTGSRDVLSRSFGFISEYVFNLPYSTFPAIFLGLVGGYPTGALLTLELFKSGEIDSEQAKRMLRFNFCGGCGFIITAVGANVYNDIKIGLLLYFSSVLSSVLLGFLLSFTKKREHNGFYSFTKSVSLGDAIIDSTQSAVSSVLSITAFIVLFCAINQILSIPSFLAPILEITSGACTKDTMPLARLCAYLCFGGLCIHFQLLGIIKKVNMKYFDFLIFRVIGAVLSYLISRVLLLIFPQIDSVFSNTAQAVPKLSSVNMTLSVLLIIGCFVLVFDINSKKKAV